MLNGIKSCIDGVKLTPPIVQLYGIIGPLVTIPAIIQDGEINLSMIAPGSLSLMAIGIIVGNVRKVLDSNK